MATEKTIIKDSKGCRGTIGLTREQTLYFDGCLQDGLIFCGRLL